MTRSVPRRRDAADDGAAGGDARVGARHGRGRARHDLARRGLPVVAQARHGGEVLDGARRHDRARDEAADGRLGDHLALHAPSGAGRHGRAPRAGGGRARAASSPASAPPRSSSTTPSRAARRRSRSRSRTMRDSVEIMRGILGGERFEYDGKVFSADIPALSPDAHVPRWDVPVYVAGTAPLMQQLGGEIGDGLLTPSITTPDFVRYTLGNVRIGAEKAGRDPASVDVGCTVVASIHATRPRRGPRRRARDRRHVPRQQGAEHPGLGRHAARPRADRPRGDPARRRRDGGGRPAGRQGQGHRLDPRPLQAHRRHARRLRRRDRGVQGGGCTHVMLELWGADRHEQIRLFGEQVLPRVRA